MRKNLKRIASLAIACVLLSVPAFAALTGSYADGTFTVTGAEGQYQTSLIIVDGACTELPINGETVTGAVYIDQVASAADTGDAAFGGVAIADDGVYTAFFSNETEKSASSVKFTTASIEISADENEVAAGEEITLSVDATNSVTDANTKLYVDGVETATTGTLNGGLKFSIETEGTSKVKLVSTVEGVAVESNEIEITVAPSGYTFAVNAAEVVAGKVYNTDDEGNTINGEIVTPVYVNVTLPAGALNKMKWVLTTPDGDVPSETIQMNDITVGGDATFAAVFKNGLYVDGEDTDYVEVSGVGAIFNIDGENYYTNDAYAEKVEGGNN